MSQRKLVDMEITAVAGVDSAANKRKFLIVKRTRDPDEIGKEDKTEKEVTITADKPSLGKRLLEGIRKMMGMGAMTMDQMMASQEMEDELYDKEWKLGSAFRQSVDSIVNDTEMDMEKKKEMLGQTMEQYQGKLAEHMQAVMDLMQQKAGGTMGSVTKTLTASDPKPNPDPGTQQPDPDPVKKKEGEVTMTLEDILKALKPDEQAVVRAEIAKSATPAAVPESVTKRIEELEKTATKVEAFEKRATEAEANVTKLQVALNAEIEKSVIAEFAKRATQYPTSGTVEHVSAKLRKAYGVSDEYGKEIEADLAKVEQLVKDAKLFEVVGRSGNAPVGSAAERLEKMAHERAAKDNINYHAAYDKVLQENHDLYKQYRAEEGK